ncbi:MAG: hypothetical protein CVV13_03300 [Gammaproteobacteria bacterium HGW-Gammaproteobacteria-3]|nr:MAG: hypothetical protein CVV13_03300 [Gammaproteobacteria bacterium HGW-Gammaproteobacteria-3]
MNTHKLLGSTLFSTFFALSPLAEAVENELKKPQTMEDMWQIIQAQQQQINAMKQKLEQASAPPPTDQVQTLERKTSVLTEEVEKLRTELVIPETIEYKSQYGLGPAASKVYQVGKGLSIGGYGEGNYQNVVGNNGGRNDDGQRKNTDNTDLERIVLYAGYKFTDNILFNSEIEFEHATTGEGNEEEGEVSVEFAALDFFIDPLANIRAGLVLMPMGFINPIHEPPFFFGNQRPLVERVIIPATWREAGVGLFGQITPDLTYTAYVVSGLDAEEFSSDGIRAGRGGASQAKAESFAFVGRMDYTPSSVPGLMVGGSAYAGNAGQNQTFAGRKADVLTQLYEAHVQWKYRGLEFRTLGSYGHIDDAGILSAAKGETIGEDNFGWYSELGYDIMPFILSDSSQYLAPFFRYEKLDTIANAPSGFSDDASKNQRVFQVGLNYKPIPNVVIKADYRNRDSKGGDLPDDFNLGFGFIF